MSKQKTRKSAAKRIKITKHKKILVFKSGRRHLLGGKTQKRKRHLRRPQQMPKGKRRTVKRALPYAF